MADQLQRFLLENLNVRGEWVKLTSSWKKIQHTAAYPAPVRKVLGDALAAISLLSGSLKYDGMITLQIRGTLPVSLLVVQASSEGGLRGIAHWQGDISDTASFQDLFGTGTLVISVENHKHKSFLGSQATERYQSLVSLDGDSLAACFKEYFAQSEQLKSRLWIASNEEAVAGILLQSLPIEDQDQEISDRGWEHAVILADTLKDEELLNLDAETILHRLYHEEDLRLFTPRLLQFDCSCSQQKVEDTIRSLGETEAQSIVKEQGSIQVDCEFCNTHYVLDNVDVKRLFSGEDKIGHPGTGSVH